MRVLDTCTLYELKTTTYSQNFVQDDTLDVEVDEIADVTSAADGLLGVCASAC